MKFENIDFAVIYAKARELPRWALLGGAFAIFVIIAVIVGHFQGDSTSAATSAVTAAAAPASTANQVFPGCPMIPLSASSAERKAVTAQCGRAADEAAAATEARQIAQSNQAWAELSKRANEAQAKFRAEQGESPAPATAPAMGVGGPLTLILPPQPAPADLAVGHATYTLESAQPAVKYGTSPGAWTTVGSATVAVTTSVFGSMPDRKLAEVTPATGFVRETWTFWFDAQTSGQHIVAAKFAGGSGAVASIAIDGQPNATAQVAGGGNGNAQTAVGTVDVATGWHWFTLTVEQPAYEVRGGRTEVDLFVRAQDDASPVSFTPYAPAQTAHTADMFGVLRRAADMATPTSKQAEVSSAVRAHQ